MQNQNQNQNQKKKQVIIYHKDEQGINLIYNPLLNKVVKTKTLPLNNNNFFVLKGDYHNEAGEIDAKSLVKFYKDFKRWCDELLKCEIDYTMYYSHCDAVKYTFIRFTGAYNKNLVENIMEKITLEEDRLFDRCNNGGMMYLNPRYIHQTVQCYGYDFSANYPSLMAKEDFLIPTTSYRKETITEIPNKFQLGIYRVKVSSTNPNFNKVFSYSKCHTYTNYSLNWALEIQDRFDVKLEIINDGKDNAFIYDSCVSGKQLFGSWFKKLDYVKKRFPKNRLVKHLLSSLWGSLSSKTTQNVGIDEYKANIELQRTTIILEHKFKGNDKVGYLKVCDVNNLYKVNIRLKSFLTSYARVNISRVILDNIDSFVRVQTDSATFTREINYQKYERLLPEGKTSGTILWNNVNRYQKVE